MHRTINLAPAGQIPPATHDETKPTGRVIRRAIAPRPMTQAEIAIQVIRDMWVEARS